MLNIKNILKDRDIFGGSRRLIGQRIFMRINQKTINFAHYNKIILMCRKIYYEINQIDKKR